MRVFKPKNPRVIRKGAPIDVRYAVFVEMKGLNVLRHAIERYRRLMTNQYAQLLRNKRLPRVYEFKYTGDVADIYGG